MKIAVFEADRECQELFSALGAEIYSEDINHALKSSMPFEAISIFIHSKITKEILDLLPNLRYIQTRSTGYDHIDIAECKKRGIIVSNVHSYAGPAVGEFAFSLLLTISRHTCEALARTKEERFDYKDLLGFELCGKSIGILGLGTIGKQMVRIAYGFGMQIYGYARHQDPDLIERYNLCYLDLDAIYAKSDVIMFALPLTPQTRHILDLQKAKLLKPDAILINCARGELISREALAYLLENGHYVASDVLEGEKELFKHKTSEPLLHHPRFFYTPHMAYYTKEALQRIRTISLENMKRFLQGREILHRIT